MRSGGEVTSRERTDALLATLRDGRWRPSAWARFLEQATRLSWMAAMARPVAAAEVTAVHALMFAGCDRRGRRWVTVSWTLAITHLGLLDERRTLGVANHLTLLRANLPALADGPEVGLVAIATDVIDGRVARRHGQVTAFGGYADSLADAVFWIWFALRHEPSPLLRATALAAWTAPAATVALLSFGRGGIVEPPRPAMLRPAAAMQAVLAARAMRASRAGD